LLVRVGCAQRVQVQKGRFERDDIVAVGAAAQGLPAQAWTA
jgi:hypothetical protein